MTDKTHQLIGLSATTGLFFMTHDSTMVGLPIAATILVGSSLGSLAPDIDQPTAHIWRQVPLGGLFGHITAAFLGGHRNLSHSLLGVLLFGSLGWFLVGLLPNSVDHLVAWQSFMTGYIFHLLADAVTVMGVPLLWPFGGYIGLPPHPFQGLRIETGKWFENWVVFPLVLLLLAGLIIVNV